MEVEKSNILSTKNIQINACTCDLALSNCHACDNCTPIKLVFEKTAKRKRTKLNVACVGACACDCTSFAVRPTNWVNSAGFYLKVFKKIKYLKSLEGILSILSTC